MSAKREDSKQAITEIETALNSVLLVARSNAEKHSLDSERTEIFAELPERLRPTVEL